MHGPKRDLPRTCPEVIDGATRSVPSSRKPFYIKEL